MAGPYELIYADPPWPVRGSGVVHRGADRHYELMSIKDIVALGERVQEEYAADDSFLLMWSVSNFLPASLEVMRAWGFRYVTNMVWVKDRIGLGHYFRAQHEFLLLGVRGHPPYSRRPGGEGSKKGRKVHPSVLHSSRRAHSEKPEEVYEVLDTFSQGPRVELFARRERKGWDTVGLELGSRV